MIPGVVASSLGLAIGGGDPGDLSDAVAFFDFVNEVYEIDGSPVSVGDNIDKAGNVVPGNGLSIDWDVSGDFATVSGDLLMKLTSQESTIVIEVEETEAGNYSSEFLEVYNTGNSDSYRIFADDGSSVWASNNPAGLGFLDVFITSGIPARPSTKRIAVTTSLALTKLVISCNGSAIQSETGSLPAYSWNAARIGALEGDTFPEMNGYVRLIAVLPVRDDADLPALSAL